MRIIEFTVTGDPAPQGSKDFKGMAGGHAILVESSKKVKPWRQDVAFAAREAMKGQPPLDGPLMAHIVFTLRKPASAPKKRRTYPDRKPDLSKLLRSTEDALVTGGAIKDDARIVAITELRKAYPGEHPLSLPHPGAWIRVWEIAE